jgi:methionyl-tRNA formyltransferase
MRCAVFGGVVSTRVLVEGLARHGFSDVRVWGYEPDDASRVSGWTDLKPPSQAAFYQYAGFRRVIECEEALREFAPDVVFVVGWSQLVPASMLSVARVANVGFHPTRLPKGRGRAPIAWLILEHIEGAATFFELREDADDGPIFVQVPFDVADNDDAAAVYEKVLRAESAALDEWLPTLKGGEILAKEQDHAQASWFGRRDPKDGLVNWASNRQEILRLVRATAPPHPGAFSYCGDVTIRILSAVAENRDERGVIGRILSTFADGSFDVQTGDRLIRVLSWRADSDWLPRVGMKLGYNVETEIVDLRERVRSLEETVSRLCWLQNLSK